MEKKRASARSTTIERPADVPMSVWQDFQAIRKAKRAPLTDTALAGIRREAGKAGLSLADAIAYCCEAGWQGFNAAWYANRQGPSAHASPGGPQTLSASGAQTLANAAALKKRLFPEEFDHA